MPNVIGTLQILLLVYLLPRLRVPIGLVISAFRLGVPGTHRLRVGRGGSGFSLAFRTISAPAQTRTRTSAIQPVVPFPRSYLRYMPYHNVRPYTMESLSVFRQGLEARSDQYVHTRSPTGPLRL
jgi:uncharacterized protein (DUF58 family)